MLPETDWRGRFDLKSRRIVQGPPIDLATLAVAACLAELGAMRGPVRLEAAHVAEGLGLTGTIVKLRLRSLAFLGIIRSRRVGDGFEVEITPEGAALLSAVVRPLLSLLLPPMRLGAAGAADGRAS